MDNIVPSPRYINCGPRHPMHPMPKIDGRPSPRYCPSGLTRAPNPDAATLRRDIYVRTRPVFQYLRALSDPKYAAVYGGLLGSVHSQVGMMEREASHYSGHNTEIIYRATTHVLKAMLALSYDDGQLDDRKMKSMAMCRLASMEADLVDDCELRIALKNTVNIVLTSILHRAMEKEEIAGLMAKELVERWEMDALTGQLGDMATGGERKTGVHKRDAKSSEEAAMDAELSTILMACAIE